MALRVAVERVMHRNWEVAYRYGVLQEKGEANRAVSDRLIPQANELADELFEKLKAGKQIRPPRYSVHEPPTTLFFKNSEATWIEVLGGKRYTVQITNDGTKRAHVHIGRSGRTGLMIDPTRLRVDMGRSAPDAEGDAYVSGSINLYDGNLYGKLFMIVAHEGRRRAGSRALTLWCDLMDGYGIERWIAEAVGDEGMAFFEGLARKGKIKIYGRRGSDLGIECVSMHPNPKIVGWVTP